MKKNFLIILATIMLLSACSPSPTNVQPVNTPLSQDTPAPSATIVAKPTATDTPIPIIPTDTLTTTPITPTNTNVPPTLLPCSSPAELVSPENNAKLDTLIPVFEWRTGNDSDAQMSDLYIAADKKKLENQSFDMYVGGGNKIGITELNLVPFFGRLSPATTYYWHVQLKCRQSGGKAPYSEIWSFTTGEKGTILPAPKQVDNKINGEEVTFEWESVEGAVEYYIEVEGMFGSTTRDQSFKSKLPAGKTYKWRVTARNEYSWGKASPYKQFVMP